MTPWCITGTYEGLFYTLRLRSYGERVHAEVRLRSTRPVLIAYLAATSLEVILPPVRSSDVLCAASDALAILGTPVDNWRLFIATHERGAGFIATRWYEAGRVSLNTVDLAARLHVHDERVSHVKQDDDRQ
jgi:hypothetical protein